MNTVSRYRMAKLGAALRDGAAWIEGLACDGDRWPDGRHYYVIAMADRIYHVPTSARPTWGRYVDPALRGGN